MVAINLADRVHHRTEVALRLQQVNLVVLHLIPIINRIGKPLVWTLSQYFVESKKI